MVDEPANGNDIDDNPPAPNVVLLAERQRQLMKRMANLERKHKEMETMMNRFIGGSALLIGVGVFIGWLFTIGSWTLDYLRK